MLNSEEPSPAFPLKTQVQQRNLVASPGEAFSLAFSLHPKLFPCEGSAKELTGLALSNHEQRFEQLLDKEMGRKKSREAARLLGSEGVRLLCPVLDIGHGASLRGCCHSTELLNIDIRGYMKVQKEDLAPSQPYASTADKE
ncbi:hypothetical protein Anapl_02944 [Anas platyrhynchos]|uniref:Uncharacterized protein n=1 Tax=Anas platyrhynchos TaxID=8839 RepID=R0JNQ5_ANAPL|nr:hypothetical protein Anapl_02944 [Anas platyrhynchos]